MMGPSEQIASKLNGRRCDYVKKLGGERFSINFDVYEIYGYELKR